ncbi:MAG TPA: hypothetical protein VII91_08320 [Bauldia sp.]
MNSKVSLLVVGLLVGGLLGYVTRPESTDIKVGPIQLNVQTDQTAAPGDAVTSSGWQHIGIFAVIGAIVGLGLGFAVDSRRA